MTTLVDLTSATGRSVDPHLALELEIPIHAGIQAQGDLLIIPLSLLVGRVTASGDARWAEVAPEGVELLRGGTGGNAHTLVADPGTCVWTADVVDPDELAIAVFEALSPVYLLHREHGGTGVAPGAYVVRRQRELAPPPPPVRGLGIEWHRATPRAVEAERAAAARVRYIAD